MRRVNMFKILKNSREILQILVLMCVFFGSPVNAQFLRNVSKSGTTAANFLEIGIGARAVGLGGAYVATADDIASLYWNPAGLHYIENFQLLMNHINWIADIDLDYFGFAKNISGIGTIGISIAALTMNEMDVRTVDQPDGTGEKFSANDLAIQLSFARLITDRFAIGLSIKGIYEQIWHMSSNGFALDFGTLYQTNLNGMIIGMSISNFGASMKLVGRNNEIFADIDKINGGNNDKIRASLNTDEFPLPLIFRFGLMMPFYISSNNIIRFSIDGIHPNNNYESVNVGLEYELFGKYALRGGYNSLFLKDSEGGMTVGAGLNLSPFEDFDIRLDYTYQDFGRLINTQFFSISVRL